MGGGKTRKNEHKSWFICDDSKRWHMGGYAVAGGGNGSPVHKSSKLVICGPSVGHLPHLPLIPLQHQWPQYPSIIAPALSVGQ